MDKRTRRKRNQPAWDEINGNELQRYLAHTGHFLHVSVLFFILHVFGLWLDDPQILLRNSWQKNCFKMCAFCLWQQKLVKKTDFEWIANQMNPLEILDFMRRLLVGSLKHRLREELLGERCFSHQDRSTDVYNLCHGTLKLLWGIQVTQHFTKNIFGLI